MYAPYINTISPKNAKSVADATAAEREKPEKPEAFKIDRGDTLGGTEKRNLLGNIALETSMYQPMAQGTVNLLGEKGAVKGSKVVQGIAKGANVLNLNNANLVKNAATAAKLGRLASLASPMGIVTGLDMLTSMYRDDGKGLYELAGETIGGGIGKAIYGSGDGYGDDEGMRTLSEENERREAQGMPALSASEGVDFLKSINPNQFDAYNERRDKEEGIEAVEAVKPVEAVNKTPAEKLGIFSKAQGVQAPNLQQALAPSGKLPYNGGQAPEGALIGSYQAPDDQSIGMFQGQENAPITQGQLDSLAGQMVDSGAPFISGGMTDASGRTIAGPAGRPEGMKPYINAMGQVEYADPQTAIKMNEIEARRIQEEKAAQQRAIQSMASRGSIPQSAQKGSPQANFIQRMKTAKENPLTEQEIAQGQAIARSMGTTFDPQTGYSRDAFLQDRAKPRASAPSGGSEFAQASRDREARLEARPDFNEVRRGKSSGTDGLTDAQRRKIYGSGTKEFEMSKAGINPQTGARFEDEAEDRRREIAYDDAKIESLGRDVDPTKLQQVQSQVQALMEGLVTGPDGETLSYEDLEDIRRRLMLRLLAPTADQYSSPFSPTSSSTEENT